MTLFIVGLIVGLVIGSIGGVMLMAAIQINRT